MKLKFSACLTLLFLILVNINNAQIENDNKINYLEFNGKVVNSENKEPLVFANINLIGSNVSTISNSDGDFTLKIPKSFSPKKIKMAITGNGNSSKEQVAKMLKTMLDIKEMPKNLDSTDGLAAAVCHYFNFGNSSSKKEFSNWASYISKNPDKLV